MIKQETAIFYIDVYGDIFGTLEEAEVCGLLDTVETASLYVGSYADMMASAKQKWVEA